MTDDMPQSDDAIRRSTGKGWDEWFDLLNDWGGADKTHTEIAAYINGELGVDGWWAQGVTVGYERKIGRRAVGQRNDGTYSASASKTINASAERVLDALVDENQRSQWLPADAVTLRTFSAPKSARFDDHEAGLIIAFFLTAKGDEKTSLQVQADKLASPEAGEIWKQSWKIRLNDLAAYLKEK